MSSVPHTTLKHAPADSKARRIRRARRARYSMRELGATRLCVHRTPKHIYAQIISGDGGRVLAAASTLDKSFADSACGNMVAAKKVGEMIAERAKEHSISRVAFDRSGFKYHGRVKALAEGARQAGLEF